MGKYLGIIKSILTEFKYTQSRRTRQIKNWPRNSRISTNTNCFEHLQFLCSLPQNLKTSLLLNPYWIINWTIITHLDSKYCIVYVQGIWIKKIWNFFFCPLTRNKNPEIKNLISIQIPSVFSATKQTKSQSKNNCRNTQIITKPSKK